MSVPLNILTGMILGDAGLIFSGQNAHLRLQHSMKQVDYLLHKASILESITKVNVRYIEDNGYGYSTIVAETLNHPIYTSLYRRWYPNKHKSILLSNLRHLDAKGLAYWYMDDGSLTIHRELDGRPKSREFHFHTQSFSYEENCILRDFMLNRFDLKFRVSRHKGKYWVLGCGALEGKKLIDIISDYMLPMFNYKLDMQYVTQFS